MTKAITSQDDILNNYLSWSYSAIKFNGAAGDDTIYTSGFNDTINGGDGADRIYVSSGNDSVLGDAGNDFIDGSDGNDTLNGGAGLDTIQGGNGNDSLLGGADADNLDGGYNDDTLDGGVGNDTLNGSQGIDLLTGGGGNDFLTGGSEADSFIFDINATFNPANIGIDTITDFTRQTDKIILDKTTFNLLTSVVGTGFSNTSEFAVVANDTLAGASSAMIVYSSTTGNLFYNQNGIAAGLGTGGQFAQLTNSPLLSASDFTLRA